MFILPLGFYAWIRGTEVLELGVSSEFCLSLQGIDSGVQAQESLKFAWPIRLASAVTLLAVFSIILNT